MTGDDRYKLFGVYLSEAVVDALGDYLYEAAGVVDYENYFDPASSTIPVGDPGADATDRLVSELVTDFADLYDAASFETARDVDSDAFVLAYLAADPQTVANARERFQAAATIQEADLRTVQTAILSAYLSRASTRDDGDRRH